MDKTEKIVSAIPSAAELEQLAELHKACLLYTSDAADE